MTYADGAGELTAKLLKLGEGEGWATLFADRNGAMPHAA
jgi:hypothetical protein